MKRWLAIPLFLILIFLDQVTKYLAQLYLKGNDGFPLVKGVFELHYLENRGAAFGILQNKGIVFIVVSLIFLAIISLVYVRLPEKRKFDSMRLLMLLIAAGAVGNMIDRIFRGYVVDFLYFSLINFPIFNVADCYVTVSVFVFILLLFFCFSEEELEGLSLWKKRQ